MDNESPATTQDLAQLGEQLRIEMGRMATKQDLAQLGEQLRSEMGGMATKQDLAHLTDHLTELARDIETRLLTAFHGYGKGVSNRLHDYEISKRTLEDRVAILEDRILNIETGHGPGQH